MRQRRIGNRITRMESEGLSSMGNRLIDMTGLRFGRLTVIEKVNCESKSKSAMWLCKCDCGKEHVTSRTNLKHGKTKSCGCLREEARKRVCSTLGRKGRPTHGLSKTKLYKTWDSMKCRCKYKRPEYKTYHDNNITVCEAWLNDFKEFYDWAMSNGYKDSLTLDRINNKEGYNPNNCRWVTMKEQENNRTNNHLVEINGVIKTVAEWSDFSGLAYSTIRNRIYKGWKGNEIIRPARKKRRHIMNG
jgi:hypothetical protein